MSDVSEAQLRGLAPDEHVTSDDFATELERFRELNEGRTEAADPLAFKKPPALRSPDESRGGGGGGGRSTTLPGYDPDTLMRTGQVLKQMQLMAPELLEQPNGRDIAMGIAMTEGDPIENLMAVLEANNLLSDEATIQKILDEWEKNGKEAAVKLIWNLPEERREDIAKAVLAERTGWDGGMPFGSLIPDPISDAVGEVGGRVLGAVGDVIDVTGVDSAVGYTLEGFAAMGRGATQLYRTGVELAYSSPDELSWDGIVAEVGDAWTAAGAGEEYVSPDRRAMLLDAVGGDQRRYDLLNKLAAGKDYKQAATEAGYTEAEMASEEMARSLFGPEAEELTERIIDEFTRSRRSFGRDLVRTGMLLADVVGLGEHDIYGTDMSSGWAKYVSGIGDGVWAITMDPLILAGSGRRALTAGYRAALGVRSADDSFRLALSLSDDSASAAMSAAQRRHALSVRAATDQLAEAINAGNIQAIAHRPSLFPAFRELVEVSKRRVRDGLPGLGDTDALLDYLTNDGQALVARTVLGGRNTARRTVAPTWGATDRAFYQAKTGLHKVVNLAKMPEQHRRLLLAGDELSRMERMAVHLGAPVTKVLHAPAQAWTFFTTHAPYRHALMVDLDPRAAASQWDMLTDEGVRFFSLGRAFGMDEEEILRYTNMFLVGDSATAAGTQMVSGAGRRQTIMAFMEDLFSHIGLDEAHPIVQKYLSLEGQRYTLDNLVGGKRAFLPGSQTSLQIAVPNARELFRAATNYSHTRKMLNVAMPNALEAGLNRIWKPGVLLRAGFITRAAGEELIAYLARFGPKGYIGTQMAVGHVQHRIFDETVFGQAAATAGRNDLYEAVARMTGMRPDDLAEFAGRLGIADPLAQLSGRQFVTMGASRLWAPLHGFTNLLHHASLVFARELDDAALARIAQGAQAPLRNRIAGLAKVLDDQVLTAAIRGRHMKGVGAVLNPLRAPAWMNRGWVGLQASLEADLVAGQFMRYVSRKAGIAAPDGRITQETLARALAGYTNDDFIALGEALTDPFIRRTMAERIGVDAFANNVLRREDVGQYRHQRIGVGRDGRPLYRKVRLTADDADQVTFLNPQLTPGDVAEFRSQMAARANEVVRDPFVGPVLHHLLDHVDDDLAVRLARLAPEGVDPIEHAQQIRNALQKIDRNIARRYENARLGYDGKTTESLLRELKAMIDPDEVGGLAKRAALDTLMSVKGDEQLVQVLLGTGQLTRDLDEVLNRIRSELHRRARLPKYQRLLSGSEEWAAAMLRPQDADYIPIYGVMVNPAKAPDIYTRLATDTNLQRAIVSDLVERHPEIDARVFEDLVARIIEDGSDLTMLHSGLVEQGARRSALTRWVTNDDRVARSVEEVLSTRLNTYVGMGRHQVHRDEWYSELGSLRHVNGDPEGLAHLATNDAHLLNMEVVPPNSSTVLLQVEGIDRALLGRTGTAGRALWRPGTTGMPDELAEYLPAPRPGRVRLYQGSDEALGRWYLEPPIGPEIRFVDVPERDVRLIGQNDWSTGQRIGQFARISDEAAEGAVTFARRVDGTWVAEPIDVTDWSVAWDTGPHAAWELDEVRDGLARLAAGEDPSDEVVAFLTTYYDEATPEVASRVLAWDRLAGPGRPIRELTEAEYDELVELVGEELPVKGRRVVPQRSPTDPEAFEDPINKTLHEIELRFTSRHAHGDSERVLLEAVGPTLHRESRDLADDVWGGVPMDDLPVEVYGPRLADASESTWDQLVRVGFDAVSASVASIIRKPLFLQEYVQARKTVAPFFAAAEARLNAQRQEVEAIFAGGRWEMEVWEEIEPGEWIKVKRNFWDGDALDEFVTAYRTNRVEIPWPDSVHNLNVDSEGAFQALLESHDLDELADISLQLRFSMLPSETASLEDANRMLQIAFDIPDPELASVVRQANARFNWTLGDKDNFRSVARTRRLDGLMEAVDAGVLDVSDVVPHDRLRAAYERALQGGPRGGAYVSKAELRQLNERFSEWRLTPEGEQFVDDAVARAKERFLNDRRYGRAAPHPADLSAEEMAKLQRYIRSRIAHEDTVRDVTVQRALQGVIPFIDDHRIRSQFQEYVGNLIPFWFAEEQFLKRWARIIAQSPEVIRYGQLTMQAARTSGVIRDDGFGGEVFVIPASEVFTKTLVALSSKLLPGDIVEPLANPLTMSTAYMLPGFGDQTGAPSFGPMVGIGLEFLTSVNPELGYRLARQFRTDETGSRDYLDHLMPAHFQRLRSAIEAWQGGENEALAAATISAMARLEAAGHGLPEHATPEEMQAYLDRVTNQGRIEMTWRMVLGWAGPTTPGFDLQPEWADELQQMLDAGVPYEDAITIYLARHPDATMSTISKTVSTSGASLSADEAALAEMFELLDSPLADRYPDAAAWLILPQRTPEDEYAAHVFHAQLRAGFRERRSPEEFLRASVFQQSADRYFSTIEEMEAEIDAARAVGDDATARHLQANLDTWRTSFLARNPIFAEELNSSAGRQRREKILRQASLLIRDEDFHRMYPEKAEALIDLISLTEDYRGARYGLQASRSKEALAARALLDDDFATKMSELLDRQPDLRTFYDRVIRPALQLDDLEEMVA